MLNQAIAESAANVLSAIISTARFEAYESSNGNLVGVLVFDPTAHAKGHHHVVAAVLRSMNNVNVFDAKEERASTGTVWPRLAFIAPRPFLVELYHTCKAPRYVGNERRQQDAIAKTKALVGLTPTKVDKAAVSKAVAEVL